MRGGLVAAATVVLSTAQRRRPLHWRTEPGFPGATRSPGPAGPVPAEAEWRLNMVPWGRRPDTTKMFDIKAWAEYVVEWAAKDPYGFLTTVILALTPLFLASAVLSWKLAKMIEAREKEQKKKQKRQENIAKAKRLKKD
ncbi:small integral membrane protein 15 isoform X1 [Panthera pardus]|uniref:Small integral membrane protein 15 n=2 Tax=Pantherinae TaxID=338153 RepID=A0A9V1DXU0_PANPR|nr:small integral membrane protein 15 isoform X1 [Panthera pardus]XP_060491694.1 small integral membrane protein 15 isoform X1 [Panthera onca]